MARHTALPRKPDVARRPAIEVVRAVTVMVDLCSNGSTTTIVGVLNTHSRKYHFINLLDGEWTGSTAVAMANAVAEAGYAIKYDAETIALLK